MSFSRGSILFLTILLSTAFLPNPASAQAPSSDTAPAQNKAFEKPRIIRVDVEGNKRVAAEDIRAAVSSREGGFYDTAIIAADVRSLYDLGYFDDIRVDRQDDAGGVVITFIVDEKPAISEVVLDGYDEVDEDDILEVMDIEENSILSVPKIKKNVQKIQDLYAEEGHFLAEVTYEIEEEEEHSVKLIFNIKEHAQVEVRRINFVGNRALSDEEIMAVMQTQTPGFFSILTDSGTFRKDMFEQDVTLVTALYWDYGYLQVRIGEPRVELSADKRYIYISIPVQEGPRFRVGRIKVVEHDRDGNEVKLLKGRRYVRELVETERGEWFSRSKVAADINRISLHYKNHGYAHVNIDSKTTTHDKEKIVDLYFDIERGPVVYFERIQIRGNKKTRDKVIRREFLITEGEKYSQSRLDASKSRVTALGYFERVDVSTSPGSKDNQIIVNFEVEEKSTGTFQLSVGFSTWEQLIGMAQVQEQNLFGHGQTLTLQAQLSSLRQLFRLSFMDPYFLDSNWTFAFDVFNYLRAYENFNRESVGGSLTFGYPLIRDLRLYLTYQLEDVDISTRGRSTLWGGYIRSGLRDLPLANLFRTGLTSSVKSTLAYDRRNNRLFPTDGSYNSVSVEQASPYLGSDIAYTRWRLSSRWYVPLFWKFVFRLNAKFGLIYSNTPEGVPLFERFFSGGILDVRGFRPFSLGPRLSVPPSLDPSAEPRSYGEIIGGNMQVTFNNEIEFPIIEKFGLKGVIFFDAGNSFNLESTWCQASGGRGINDFTDPCNANPIYLRTSAGFGFRWFSPMGPLRFEWGFPTKTYPGEDDYNFEFTFGNFF